jgi:hypothetical protein
MSGGRSGKSMTFGESTSGKLSDFEYKVVGFGCGPWTWYKGVGEIYMNKWRVGEERRGKETDGCPLTSGASVAQFAITGSLCSSLRFHSASLAKVSTKPGQSSSHPENQSLSHSTTNEELDMYGGDYLDIYKTRCDAPSRSTARHDGGQYDIQNNDLYRRRDWHHPKRVEIEHQRYSS